MTLDKTKKIIVIKKAQLYSFGFLLNVWQLQIFMLHLKFH